MGEASSLLHAILIFTITLALNLTQQDQVLTRVCESAILHPTLHTALRGNQYLFSPSFFFKVKKIVVMTLELIDFPHFTV